MVAVARTCEQLRKQGHVGDIALVTAEDLAPYDRPPLSKGVLLGKRDVTPFKINYGALGVDLHLARTATSVHFDDRVVSTTSGPLPYEKLVLATGASPIRLPGSGEQFVLRDAADAYRLRERLTPGARVVVVGASWIGAEVATAALARGCIVTCIEPGHAPLAQALGPVIGSLTELWWGGVDLRLNVAVESIEDGGVAVSEGMFIDADVVVTGVGVRPDTEWLRDSGLTIGRGVHTDEALRTDVDGVIAVGDVAAWLSRRFNTRLCTGHWDDASAGAAVAAASVIGGQQSELVHDPVPYFWSDQFEHKLQYVGHHGADDDVVFRPDDGSLGWTACWFDSDRCLSAVLNVDRPRSVVAARTLLASRCVMDVDKLESTDLDLAGCVLA